MRSAVSHENKNEKGIDSMRRSSGATPRGHGCTMRAVCAQSVKRRMNPSSIERALPNATGVTMGDAVHVLAGHPRKEAFRDILLPFLEAH